MKTNRSTLSVLLLVLFFLCSCDKTGAHVRQNNSAQSGSSIFPALTVMQSSRTPNHIELAPSPDAQVNANTSAATQNEISLDGMTFSGLTLMETTIDEASKIFTSDLNKNDYGDIVTFTNAEGVEVYFRKLNPEDEHRFFFFRITGNGSDIVGPRGLTYNMDVRDFLATLPIEAFNIEELSGDGSSSAIKVLYDNGIIDVDQRKISVPPSAICVVFPPYYDSGNILIAYPVNEVTRDQLVQNDERDIPMFRIWISFEEYEVKYFAVYYGGLLQD